MLLMAKTSCQCQLYTTPQHEDGPQTVTIFSIHNQLAKRSESEEQTEQFDVFSGLENSGRLLFTLVSLFGGSLDCKPGRSIIVAATAMARSINHGQTKFH